MNTNIDNNNNNKKIIIIIIPNYNIEKQTLQIKWKLLLLKIVKAFNSTIS